MPPPHAAPYPKVVLHGAAGARVARGHAWIFSNDIKTCEASADYRGSVSVYTESNQALGSAVYNHHALIRCRVYTRGSEPFDRAFIRQRISEAIDRRRQLLPGRQALRLIFSESDQLPGLIVDQYGPALAVQFHTQAMEDHRGDVLSALQELLAPTFLLEKSDTATRDNEQIAHREPIRIGEAPEELVVAINGLRFGVQLESGQKTGLYLDQHDNWPLVRPFAAGRKVLDLFSNVGGFSLHAAAAGAASVKAVDSSDLALSQLLFNANRNGLTDKIRTKKSDSFLYVRSQPEQFGLIICDPPAFAKSRKQLDSALRGYRELNRQCLKMLEPHGALISCSCSAAVGIDDFEKMLGIAAKDAGRPVRLLARYGLPLDHAPLLAMPETHYLKVFVVEAIE